MATSQYTPFIESELNEGREVLRARMDEYGYLFFRSLVPADRVLRARRAVLEHCREAGWLDPSREMLDGVASPDMEPISESDPATKPQYLAVYRKILKTPVFHDFPQQPELMQAASQILSGEVLVHPRRIGRVTWPRYEQATTPPHQDHFYIRGAVETYSCWTPLGECPMKLGSLAVWPGSHRRGFIEHSLKIPYATGGSGVPVEDEIEWHASDFGIGDALFFHSFTVHKALPNRTEDRLRLSTDNRYQAAQDEIDPASLKPHFNLD